MQIPKMFKIDNTLTFACVGVFCIFILKTKKHTSILASVQHSLIVCIYRLCYINTDIKGMSSFVLDFKNSKRFLRRLGGKTNVNDNIQIRIRQLASYIAESQITVYEEPGYYFGYLISLLLFGI